MYLLIKFQSIKCSDASSHNSFIHPIHRSPDSSLPKNTPIVGWLDVPTAAAKY